MRLDEGVPMNNRIDKTELFTSSFDFPKEPFDFAIGLGMVYASDNVFDVVVIQEIPECVMSMFAISGRDELGNIISQDLAR